MPTFDPKYKIDWPVGTVEVASQVFGMLDALLMTLMPNATILSNYDIDDFILRDLGDEVIDTLLCPLVFSFKVVPPECVNLPSFIVAIDGTRELIALGPNWLGQGMGGRWYWENKAPNSVDDQVIITELQDEIMRWLDGRITVYYVFRESKLVGCQINDGDTMLWRRWRRRVSSKHGLLVVRNDPRSVEGYIQSP